MREEVLKRFFDGAATAAELAADVAGSTQQVSDLASVVKIEDMQDEYTVTRRMAASLCDAVLKNELSPDALATIGFCLMASDKFAWDADVDPLLADVIADWASPEISYPLTLENVERFSKWLSGEQPYPERPSQTHSQGQPISSTQKQSVTSGNQ